MAKKSVTVRKNIAERIMVCASGVVLAVLITLCVILLRTTMAILLYLAPALILLPWALYICTWQIDFDEHQIIRTVFFRIRNTYSYAQLQEAVQVYSTAENGYIIRMKFNDGKLISFRQKDTCGPQAVKVLMQHRSIKIK